MAKTKEELARWETAPDSEGWETAPDSGDWETAPDVEEPPPAPEAPTAPAQTSILRAIQHGVSNWVPMRAARILARTQIPGTALTAQDLLVTPEARLSLWAAKQLGLLPQTEADVKKLEPATPTEKAVSFVTELLDPATWVVGGAAGKLGAKALFNATKLARAERYVQVAKAGKALGALTAESVDRGGRLVVDRVKARTMELVAERAKLAALRAGIEGATGSALHSTFRQLDEGRVDPGEVGLHAALGLATGAAGGYALSRLLSRGAASKAGQEFLAATLPDAAEQAARGLPRMSERARAALGRQEGERQLSDLLSQMAAGKTRMSPQEFEQVRRTADELVAQLGQAERALKALEGPSDVPLKRIQRGLDALINETYVQGGTHEAVAQRLLEQRALVAQELGLPGGSGVNFDALLRDPQAYLAGVKKLEIIDRRLGELAKKGVREAQETVIEGSGQLGAAERAFKQAEAALKEKVGALGREVQKVTRQLEVGLRDLSPDEFARLRDQYLLRERALAAAPPPPARERVVSPAASPWDVKKDLDAAYERISEKINSQIQRLRQAGRDDLANALEAKKASAIAFYVHHVAGEPSPANRVRLDSFLDKILAAKERFSKLDAKHKDLRVTELFYRSYEGEALYGHVFNRFAAPYQDAVERLQRIDPNLVRRGALYLENLLTDPVSSRVYWNPQAALPRPSDEALDALIKIRALYNQAVKESGTYGRAIEFKDGYVPHLARRRPLRGGLGTTEQVVDKTFLHHQRERLDPAKHVLDLRDLGQYYFRNYAQWAAFNKMVPSLHRELIKLSAKGMYEEAEALVKQLMPVMGLKNRAELGRLVADSKLAGIEPLVREAAGEAGQAPTFADDVLKFLHRQFYNAAVFTRPFTILAQFGQPEFVGAAEIGHRWIARGRAGASRAANDAYNRWHHRLLSPDLQLHMGSGLDLSEIHNKWVQRLDRVFNLPAAPGKKLFQRGEEMNRKVVFRGAYDQFTTHVGQRPDRLAAVMEGMLDGEKRMVIRALNEGGVSKAAEVYAGIRTLRANFMFGKTDAPEFFREGLGRFVPFTTWTRNNFARLWGDLATKSYGRAVQRVAGPMLVALLISDLTDTDAVTMLTRLSPAVSVPEVLAVTANPQLEGPVAAFRRGGPSAALQELFRQTSVGQAARTGAEVGKQLNRGNAERALRALFNAPKVPESRQGLRGAARALKKEQREIRELFN